MIGRNEGEKLARCFASLCTDSAAVIYVDSGSTDGSIAIAKRWGAAVVSLDATRPFTAARARNAGFRRLQAFAPSCRYVQFVDGDCELSPGWIETAAEFLARRPDVACVCGRLRERFPERSLYNRLCDFEWDRPTGETHACGGIAMMQVTAFSALRGFREDLVAGEEPELCRRMRAAGWVVWRLEEAMAWHDAAMYRFAQWWTRSRRTGYGYAQNLAIQGFSADWQEFRRPASSWLWAGVIPLTLLALSLSVGPGALACLLIYPFQMLRATLKLHGPWRRRVERAFFLLLGRFPELAGQMQFWRRHRHGLTSRTSSSFDYKS